MERIGDSTIGFIGNILYMSLEGDIDQSKMEKKVEIRREFAKNSDILLIADITNMSSVSKNAKKYIASPEATKDIIANGIIVNSLATMMIGNLYLFFEKPTVPARLFTNQEKAIKWLQEFDPSTNNHDDNMEHNKNIVHEL